MNDALAVRGVQGIRDLDARARMVSNSIGRAEIRCFSVTPSRYSMAMNGFAILLADVVDRADVGVIQRRRGLGLALEARQRLRFGGDLVRQELQRNEAVQACVFGLVHHAHAATAEFFQDGVMRDFLSDHVHGILRRARGQVNKRVRRAMQPLPRAKRTRDHGSG